jgi:hypothetical protein
MMSSTRGSTSSVYKGHLCIRGANASSSQEVHT